MISRLVLAATVIVLTAVQLTNGNTCTNDEFTDGCLSDFEVTPLSQEVNVNTTAEFHCNFPSDTRRHTHVTTPVSVATSDINFTTSTTNRDEAAIKIVARAAYTDLCIRCQYYNASSGVTCNSTAGQLIVDAGGGQNPPVTPTKTQHVSTPIVCGSYMPVTCPPPVIPTCTAANSTPSTCTPEQCSVRESRDDSLDTEAWVGMIVGFSCVFSAGGYGLGVVSVVAYHYIRRKKAMKQEGITGQGGDGNDEDQETEF